MIVQNLGILQQKQPKAAGTPAPYVVCIPTSRSFSSASGTTTFDVSTNGSFAITENPDSTWLSASPTSGTAGLTTITVTYGGNKTGSARNMQFVVTVSPLTATCTMYQSA